MAHFPWGPRGRVEACIRGDAPEPSAHIGRVEFGADLGCEHEVIGHPPLAGELACDALTLALLAQGVDASLRQGEGATGLLGLGVPTRTD